MCLVNGASSMLASLATKLNIYVAGLPILMQYVIAGIIGYYVGRVLALFTLKGLVVVMMNIKLWGFGREIAGNHLFI